MLTEIKKLLINEEIKKNVTEKIIGFVRHRFQIRLSTKLACETNRKSVTHGKTHYTT